MTKLKIGDRVKVIETNKKGIVTSTTSGITFNLEVRLNGEIGYRYFKESELQLIKPKNKKVKKWKNTREWLKTVVNNLYNNKHLDKEGHDFLIQEITSTQPKPIKEECKPLIEKCPNCIEPNENIKPCKDGSCGVCGGKGYIEWEKVGKLINKQEESKDIEFEEIEEIEDYFGDVEKDIDNVQNKVNVLIHNQKKIIDYINSKEK